MCGSGCTGKKFLNTAWCGTKKVIGATYKGATKVATEVLHAGGSVVSGTGESLAPSFKIWSECIANRYKGTQELLNKMGSKL